VHIIEKMDFSQTDKFKPKKIDLDTMNYGKPELVREDLPTDIPLDLVIKNKVEI
jgi:hypothetical protein